MFRPINWRWHIFSNSKLSKFFFWQHISLSFFQEALDLRRWHLKVYCFDSTALCSLIGMMFVSCAGGLDSTWRDISILFVEQHIRSLDVIPAWCAKLGWQNRSRCLCKLWWEFLCLYSNCFQQRNSHHNIQTHIAKSSVVGPYGYSEYSICMVTTW